MFCILQGGLTVQASSSVFYSRSRKCGHKTMERRSADLKRRPVSEIKYLSAVSKYKEDESCGRSSAGLYIGGEPLVIRLNLTLKQDGSEGRCIRDLILLSVRNRSIGIVCLMFFKTLLCRSGYFRTSIGEGGSMLLSA